MLQGEIYWFDLSKINSKYKARPCIVISNDKVATFADTIEVMPLKSYYDDMKLYPSDTVLKIRGKRDRLAQGGTLHSINKKHAKQFDSKLNDRQLTKVKNCIINAFSLEVK